MANSSATKRTNRNSYLTMNKKNNNNKWSKRKNFHNEFNYMKACIAYEDFLIE